MKCGTVPNGCGGTITCPDTCAVTDVCDANACCIPKSMGSACGAAVCGTASNGCGGSITCGTCAAGTSRSGGACEACALPECSNIPCGDSVTVCGETVVSCACVH